MCDILCYCPFYFIELIDPFSSFSKTSFSLVYEANIYNVLTYYRNGPFFCTQTLTLVTFIYGYANLSRQTPF